MIPGRKTVSLFPNSNIWRRTNNTERDRDVTEQRMLKAVGEMIRRDGFEKLGVNAVAAHCGVSKTLIYRYFGSLDGLLAAYIRQHDFWNQLSARHSRPRAFARISEKDMFRTMIGRLHGDPTLRRLYRWELSSKNELVAALRRQREQAGLELIARVSRKTGLPESEVAVLATFLTASVTYLVLLEEYCPVYNGIPIGEAAGWEQIVLGIDLLIDKTFPRNDRPAARERVCIFFYNKCYQ